MATPSAASATLVSGAPAAVNLYEANLALSLQVGELVRLGGQKWIASGTRLFDHAVTESAADYAQLSRREAGGPSSSALGDVFWSQVKRRSASAQAAGAMVVEQQRVFADGLREAMTTWGTAVNGALVRNDGVAPFGDAWLTGWTKWTQAWPALTVPK